MFARCCLIVSIVTLALAGLAAATAGQLAGLYLLAAILGLLGLLAGRHPSRWIGLATLLLGTFLMVRDIQEGKVLRARLKTIMESIEATTRQATTSPACPPASR